MSLLEGEWIFLGDCVSVSIPLFVSVWGCLFVCVLCLSPSLCVVLCCCFVFLYPSLCESVGVCVCPCLFVCVCVGGCLCVCERVSLGVSGCDVSGSEELGCDKEVRTRLGKRVGLHLSPFAFHVLV